MGKETNLQLITIYIKIDFASLGIKDVSSVFFILNIYLILQVLSKYLA